MSLLQIAEPGESGNKEACAARVVGIDLGTTNSLVATVRDGAPAVLLDRKGRALLPSVVYYTAEGVVVGHEAAAQAHAHPRDTVASVKRFMGRAPKDVAHLRTSLEHATSDGAVVKLRAGGRVVTPIDVSAEILRVLRERAEEELGGPIEGAVITVPAYFDDAQRQATRDAGRLAGLEVMRLVAEPTAAALAYGLDKGAQGTYAIFDLGGGTFDVSILQLVDGVFEVKATGGDSALGGDDFDRAIAEQVIGQLGDDASAELWQRCLAACRAARERLTDAESTTLAVERPDGTRWERALSRAEMETWIGPVLDRTSAPCKRALKDAGLAAATLDGVVLVGGATRMPAVRHHVAALFGREPLSDLDPDEVVALGAAVQADLLGGARGAGDVLLLDVIPLSLGIETMGGVVERLIARNSTIPCGAQQEFTTYADNQTGFDIHVVQGERDTVDHCRSLARFTLRGLPPAPAGMARCEITFLVDADGILRVTAVEKNTGIAASVDVKPSYGMSDEEVERMLVESFEHAAEDKAARLLLTERVEADRILAATRAAMDADAALLAPEVADAMADAMTALAAAREGRDHRDIHAKVEALDLASKPFAEARMNRSISRVMEGRRVDDVEKSL
jgi:molecular chaperone HscA